MVGVENFEISAYPPQTDRSASELNTDAVKMVGAIRLELTCSRFRRESPSNWHHTPIVKFSEDHLHHGESPHRTPR
jgi:hypothetical protein